MTLDFFDATSGSLVWHDVAIADYDPPRIDVARLQDSVLTAIEQLPASDPDRPEGLKPGVVRNDELGAADSTR